MLRAFTDRLTNCVLKSLDKWFVRVTSSVAFIPQIDGLRALALILVVAHHVFAIFLENTHQLGTKSLPQDWAMIYGRSNLVAWALHLRFGISMFFAISGFVLAIPFCKASRNGIPFPSMRLFLLRRLIRMEPPYVLSMTLFFVLIVIPRVSLQHTLVMFRIFIPHYLATLTYVHALIYKTPSWINGVAWTLEIEVQFYLLMPLLAQIYRIRSTPRRRWILIGLISLSAIFDQCGLPHLSDPRYGLSILGNLEFLLTGLLLADLYVEPPFILKAQPLIYDFSAAFSITLIVCVLHWVTILSCFIPFMLVMFFLSVFHGKWASRIFTLRVLTIPGTMCYTIYLYHFFIIQKILPHTLRLVRPVHGLWQDELAQMGMMLVPILSISAVLYLLTERPFVVLSHQVARRWRSRATTRVVGA